MSNLRDTFEMTLWLQDDTEGTLSRDQTVNKNDTTKCKSHDFVFLLKLSLNAARLLVHAVITTIILVSFAIM